MQEKEQTQTSAMYVVRYKEKCERMVRHKSEEEISKDDQ
jgi:hypothetical protein